MDYKENITQTRQGGLGSSDAKMVATIGFKKCLSNADQRRIAVMKGLEEPLDFTNHAMRLGDEVEMAILDVCQQQYPQAKSNPLYISEPLSQKYGFNILTHIDIEIEEENRLVWYEIKATRSTLSETIDTYKEQLAWHWMLLTEKAAALNKTPMLYIIHYPTKDMYDISEFDFANAELELIKPEPIDFTAGFEYIASIYPHFQYSHDGDITDKMLSEQNRAMILELNHVVQKIKMFEQQADSIKQQILTAMETHGIKSIKFEPEENDGFMPFSITYIPPTVSQKVDMEQLKAKYPTLYEQYKVAEKECRKPVQVKSYIKIK